MDKVRDQELMSRAVAAVVIHDLENAWKAFRVNPTGNSFEKLQEAMYAWQYFYQKSGREWACMNLISAGIGSWVERLAHEANSRN